MKEDEIHHALHREHLSEFNVGMERRQYLVQNLGMEWRPDDGRHLS